MYSLCDILLPTMHLISLTEPVPFERWREIPSPFEADRLYFEDDPCRTQVYSSVPTCRPLSSLRVAVPPEARIKFLLSNWHFERTLNCANIL